MVERDEDSDECENSGKFEGDMILNRRQKLHIIQDIASGGRNGFRSLTMRWPNATVVYKIRDRQFSAQQIKMIKDAMKSLSSVSCVKFREHRKNYDKHVVTIKGDDKGCFAHVGYTYPHLQRINFDSRNTSTVDRRCFRDRGGTIVHELLHTLGFVHMQSNPNRDEYIRVNWENVKRKHRGSLLKYHFDNIYDFGVPYDYASIMHYKTTAYSVNGKETLTPLKPVPKNIVIGQRDGLSKMDIKKLNLMYCDSKY